MNKQLKSIILIFITVLLATGCSGQYSIDITNDSVKETFGFTENKTKVYQAAYQEAKGTLEGFYASNTFLKPYVNKYEQKYVEDYYLNKDSYFTSNRITASSVYSGDFEYQINNLKKDLAQKNTFFINNIIKDSLIVNDNNIIIHNDRLPEYVINNFDEFKIIVNTSLNVSSNNADSVEDNQYVWNFNKDNYYNKTISIYIERTKDEDKNQLDNQKNNNNNTKQKNPIIGLLTVIAIYVVVVVFIIKSAKKKKI